MTKPTYEPGPGRSTSQAAFSDLTKEVARRNELAQKEAHKLRAEKERQKLLKRRKLDLM
jgi:hypothetical protein